MIYCGYVTYDNQKAFQECIENNIKKHLIPHCFNRKVVVFKEGPLNLFVGSWNQGTCSRIYFSKVKNSIFVGKTVDKIKNTLIPVCGENAKTCEEYASSPDLFWGNYVHFDVVPNNTIKITRSISGQIPFYYHIDFSEKILYFSSYLDLLFNILDIKKKANWDYFKYYLMHSNLLASQTPFNDMHELDIGSQLIINDFALRKELYWDPINYFNTDSYNKENAGSIVQNLENILKVWTKDQSDLFLDFSGGVDSTSILYCLEACLKNDITKRNRIHGLHLYDLSAQSTNELHIAESISKKLGVQFKKIDFNTVLPFSPPDLTYKPDKPFISLLHSRQELYFKSLVNGCSNPLFVNGHGGDNLFFSTFELEFISESLMYGTSKASKSLIKDYIATTRDPIYSIMNKIFLSFLKNLILAYPSYDVLQGTTCNWLSKDLNRYRKNKNYTHYFFQKNRFYLNPGKMKHVDVIFAVLKLLGNTVREPGNGIWYPFLMEPMLNHVLSIPTFKFFQKLYDRYILRKEIYSKFKEPLIWRRSKGEFTHILQKGVAENKKYIQELCLDGHFSKQKLINKDLLKTFIDDYIGGELGDQFFFLNLVVIEMFLNLHGFS